MNLFFPNLNVWLALSGVAHTYSAEAWNWANLLGHDVKLVFSRYTQVGLLRLFTNQAVMGERTLTLHQAWETYERWLSDSRVEFYPEPRGLDTAFRKATAPLSAQKASKLVGDCFLLAYAKEIDARLVTFDKALLEFARKHGYPAFSPA
jgi:predicted nucleic acid-binding protein